MSGVCAIWAFDARWEGAARQVQAGLDAMVHRGTDGFSIYFDRNIGLGHCLLDTGCNGMFVDEDGFAISFDGRIDNREALVERLGSAAPHDAARLHDKILLLLLYRSFGDALPEMLRGDFVIAIWDPMRARLFLCRDHLGVRPLFWYRGKEAFYLASEIKALCAMAGVTRFPLREAGAVEFLAGAPGASEPQNTIHEGVFRLLPGHFAFIDGEGLTARRYWRLSPQLPVRRPDTAGQLRALLQQAVNRRLRTSEPVGALLSGGLDSSSIVSLIGAGKARRRMDDVAVFSLVFANGEDESEYISAIETTYGFAATRIDCSSVAAFDDCDAIMAEQDQPIAAPNISTFRHFLRTVASKGNVRIVLDGHGGDEVVSYGNGIFQELAENGRWMRLWQALGDCEELRPRRARILARLIHKRGLRAWRRAAAHMLRRRRDTGDPVRYTATGRERPFEQAFHLDKLAVPLFSTALETIDHNAAAAGVEIRMPFLDVDLIDFCVTVPADEKWAHGMPRAILRAALDGILPPAIAVRRDKFDFTGRIRHSVLSRQGGFVHQALYDAPGRLVRYADLGKLRATWQSLRENGTIDGQRFFELWRSVMLHRWLQSRAAAPAPNREDALLPVPAE